jgi:hypothetical protein
MIFSPWGNYVPLGATPQPGSGGAGGGGSQIPGSGSGGGGPTDWSSLYSPSAVSTYGSTTAGFLDAIFGRGPGSTPPPTTTSTVPWLLIGGVLVVGYLGYKFILKR